MSEVELEVTEEIFSHRWAVGNMGFEISAETGKDGYIFSGYFGDSVLNINATWCETFVDGKSALDTSIVCGHVTDEDTLETTSFFERCIGTLKKVSDHELTLEAVLTILKNLSVQYVQSLDAYQAFKDTDKFTTEL